MKNSFSSIKAKNFRGFRDAYFSFEETAKENKCLVVVYGQNGAGKSSFAHLFDMLPKLTLMVESRLAYSSMFAELNVEDSGAEQFQKLFKQQFITNAKDIIDENKTIGSEGGLMELEYQFRLEDNRNGIYHIVFSDEKVLEESLDFRLDARIQNLFTVSEKEITLNRRAFIGPAMRDSLKEECLRLFGQTSFLGIVYHFLVSSNEEYQRKNVHQSLNDVLSFFATLSVSVAGQHRELLVKRDAKGILRDLNGQRVTPENERMRPALELGLTTYFASLSYTLDSVEYRKVVRDGNEYYSLYFNEVHGDGGPCPVPLSRLSSGTQKLVSIFFTLYNASLGRTTVIDEVDNGIHDLIIANILSSANDNDAGQLFFTTHNTLLMKKLPKGCIYFLDQEKQGETSFYSLEDFGRKVQQGTDVVSRYLDGLYGGAPFPNVPPMNVIRDLMEEELAKHDGDSDGGDE